MAHHGPKLGDAEGFLEKGVLLFYPKPRGPGPVVYAVTCWCCHPTKRVQIPPGPHPRVPFLRDFLVYLSIIVHNFIVME